MLSMSSMQEIVTTDEQLSGAHCGPFCTLCTALFDDRSVMGFTCFHLPTTYAIVCTPYHHSHNSYEYLMDSKDVLFING